MTEEEGRGGPGRVWGFDVAEIGDDGDKQTNKQTNKQKYFIDHGE